MGNLQFEWTTYRSPSGVRLRCWLGPVWVGEVFVYSDAINAAFGGDGRQAEGVWQYGLISTNVAKAWVESRAWEWLEQLGVKRDEATD